MAILDYQILKDTNLEPGDLCKIFSLSRPNVFRSLDSKASFFTCERLIKLYNSFILSNDNRQDIIKDKINEVFHYSLDFPILDIDRFLSDLKFDVGLIISENKTNFIEHIISNQSYSSLGVITNNPNFESLEKIQIQFIPMNLMIPVTYFVYRLDSTQEIKAILNIASSVYVLRNKDTTVLFGDLLGHETTK